MPSFSSADPNAFVALGMQSALGTPQTAAAKLRFAKYLAGNGFQAQLDIVTLREGSDGLDYGYIYKKQHKVAGQLVANLRPEIAGQFFQFLPGMATWDGGSAPAVHTFSTAGASFPYATLFAQHPGSDIAHLLSDVRFTGFTIEMMAGEPAKLTAPFTAITQGASFAALTPSIAVEDPFLFHYGPSYQLDGAGDSTIEYVKYTHGLGVDELQAQQVTLDDIVVMNRDVDVEVHRRYQNATEWKKIVLGAGIVPTQTVATGAVRTIGQYGAAGTLRSLDINAPLIGWQVAQITELDPDGKTIHETFNGQALKAATWSLIIQLKNVHASAYSP